MTGSFDILKVFFYLKKKNIYTNVDLKCQTFLVRWPKVCFTLKKQNKCTNVDLKCQIFPVKWPKYSDSIVTERIPCP